jgi:hypothetical protein
VGEPNGEDANQISRQLLQWEADHYNDMLFISIPDLYENLYLKTHAILQWKVSYCPNVSFSFSL